MGEFIYIHQISEKNYPDTDRFIDKVIYYINHYFEKIDNYNNMTDEVFLKNDLNTIKVGDIVNDFEGGVYLKFDFRDYETSESLKSTFLMTYMRFVKSQDSYSENFVIQLIHHIQ